MQMLNIDAVVLSENLALRDCVYFGGDDLFDF